MHVAATMGEIATAGDCFPRNRSCSEEKEFISDYATDD